MNPLYASKHEAQLLFGRGLRAGFDRCRRRVGSGWGNPGQHSAPGCNVPGNVEQRQKDNGLQRRKDNVLRYSAAWRRCNERQRVATRSRVRTRVRVQPRIGSLATQDNTLQLRTTRRNADRQVATQGSASRASPGALTTVPGAVRGGCEGAVRRREQKKSSNYTELLEQQRKKFLEKAEQQVAPRCHRVALCCNAARCVAIWLFVAVNTGCCNRRRRRSPRSSPSRRSGRSRLGTLGVF